MSVEKLLAASQQHITSLEAMAAVAARLVAHVEGIPLDPRIEPIIDKVMAAMGLTPSELASSDVAQSRAVIGLIRSFFRQAADLVENPGRPSAWTYDDPVVLESQGRASMALAAIIQQAAGSLGDLAPRLQGPNATFLDVGTGVGWLAVAMARLFPTLRIVGIDTWRPALQLATSNVAFLGDRITLREQSVADLREANCYDCVFLPGPFLPLSVVPAALERTRDALRPGGWLLFGLYAPTSDALSSLVMELRVVRSGGHPWVTTELTSLLQAKGFSNIRTLERTWQMPMTLVVGHRSH